MKSKLGTGSHLNETFIQLPDSAAASGGKGPAPAAGGTSQPNVGSQPDVLVNPFSGSNPPAGNEGKSGSGIGSGAGGTPLVKEKPSFHHTAPATSALNLIGQLETWGVSPSTPVTKVSDLHRQDKWSSTRQAAQGSSRWCYLRTRARQGGQLMCMTSELLDSITSKPPKEAWESIREYLWNYFSALLPSGKSADAEIVNSRSRDQRTRERSIELLLGFVAVIRSIRAAQQRRSRGVLESNPWWQSLAHTRRSFAA